jgi:DNA polymerase
MDARERLRRYLEQRREAGETELVFDRLSVDEAMRLLGAAAEPDATRRPRVAEPGAQAGAPGGRLIPEPGQTSPTVNADWRAVLRESDPAPARERVAPPVAAPRPAASAPEESGPLATRPLDHIPTGIVVGASGRELFGGEHAKFSTLAEIAAAVAACTKCPLHHGARNPVPGEGNPHAGLMCVGEAPGETEDQLGRPFVGKAGQLLDKILLAIGLSRDDVFICNVLKHRPPGNRNPMPDEVQACSPYLIRQIELIQPRVIVAFGTFAAQTLLNTRDGIGKLRGQVHRYYGVPLVVTYHPAALLRNPAWKRPTWDDVQLARRLLDRANSS